MKISWITDAGIRAETSQGLILFNHDENTLDESSQKDENTIAIFLNENLKKKSEKKVPAGMHSRNKVIFQQNLFFSKIGAQIRYIFLYLQFLLFFYTAYH